MKKYITPISQLLLTLSASCFAVDEPKYDVDLYVFGASFHSFHSEIKPLNGFNPGVGLGFAYHMLEKTDATIAMGGYIDSFEHQAQFTMVGVRQVFWERKGFHATVGISGGYFQGSGFNGLGVVPTVSIGYNRVDVCFTGTFNQPVEMEKYYGKTLTDHEEGKTAVLGMFLKFRLN
jgi:hypothetical protein